MSKLSPSLLILLFIFECTNNKQQDHTWQAINPNRGISSDTLDLIYDGPKGFTLAYFSRDIIQAAHIRDCEVTEQDSASSRVARKIKFNTNGNIIKDENNFFSYWFEGTVRGTYQYVYDSTNRLIRMIGIPEEDSNDSVMTVSNFNQKELLYSRDKYEFAKKLKAGADRHLPRPNDFEKYPTWNKFETYRYSHSANSVIIETIVEGKITEKKKYFLQFDSLNRLQSVKKYEDTTFTESTDYIYSFNSITGNLKRKMKDGREWTFSSKAVIDAKKNQIEKIIFKENGTEDVKMVTTYNSDGTISKIKYRNSIQTFKYTYY